MFNEIWCAMYYRCVIKYKNLIDVANYKPVIPQYSHALITDLILLAGKLNDVPYWVIWQAVKCRYSVQMVDIRNQVENF